MADVDNLVKKVLLKEMLEGSFFWDNGFAVVRADPLKELGTAFGIKVSHLPVCSGVLLPGPTDSQAIPISRVRFRGWMADRQATLWYRENTYAITQTLVPWNGEVKHRHVIEIHLLTRELDGDGFGTTAFAMPCPVNPTEPSPEADRAILKICLRAAIHEVQESLVIDGEALFNPHENGEIQPRIEGDDTPTADMAYKTCTDCGMTSWCVNGQFEGCEHKEER